MYSQLNRTYNPKEFENSIYELWLQHACFSPNSSHNNETPFVIVIPPPNVTGILHLGHGLNNSLQDILIRYHRMKGIPTLWIPGTDHAGIATQHVVEEQLRKKGITKESLGRKAFIDEVWKIKHEHHNIISTQLKKIGVSCDWNRERFTLDAGLSSAVQKVFVELYNKRLIYKGSYLVNWSTGVQSAISDDEVEFKEIDGFLYHLRYPLAEGNGYLELATTRPETLLGDTAVAVHPDDTRYYNLIGKKVKLPLTEREIPIIADSHVDPQFGTGVVKITPAHDFNDYEIGKRHNLPEINIMNPDGTLNTIVPKKYCGLSMQEARKVITADLKELGILIKQEPHKHQVGHCYRSNTVIEPYLSTQWFVKMAPLAKKALTAFYEKKIQFFPKKWGNIYTSWLNNIHDWCISRQLWWGHRIPAWYNTESGEMIVATEDPSSEEKGTFTQDEDVLDTWFSSWLWPFSVMGWPENTKDLERYFPTTSLVSGYDIIFFWIARMVMASLEFLDQVPFRDIYITGLVLDKKGRKMSKSLGNGIDPLAIISEYGADALRFTLSFMCSQGQNILIDKNDFSLGSRFANKIWNAARFLLMNIEETFPLLEVKNKEMLKPVDRWILKQLNLASENVHKNLAVYRFNDAAACVYNFFWNEFCDWYIEASKLSLYSNNSQEKKRACTLLLYLLEEGLKLLHPFLPYITEEIFQKLQELHPQKERKILMTSSYPMVEEWRNFPEEGFIHVQELVRIVRTVRSEFNIAPNIKIDFAVIFKDDFPYKKYVIGEDNLIHNLTTANTITWNSKHTEKGSITVIGHGFEVFIYILSIINKEDALTQLEKNIKRETKAFEQTSKKLMNQQFLSKAMPEIVKKEKEKQEYLNHKLKKMNSYVETLKKNLNHI